MYIFHLYMGTNIVLYKKVCVVAVTLMFTLSRQLESYDSVLNIRDVLSCY